MQKFICLLLSLTVAVANAATTRTLEADTIRSSDKTKSYTFPASSSVLAATGSLPGASHVLQVNGDAETGTAGFTASAGTYTVTTTATDVGEGLQSFSWVPGAASQTLTSTAYTIPKGLEYKACAVTFSYKGLSTNVTAAVIDGSSNVLATTTLTARTSFNAPDDPTTLGFNCGAQGSTVALRFTSSAASTALLFDRFRIGSLDTYKVSQYEFVGAISWAATVSCDWPYTNTTAGIPGADASCPTPTVSGSKLSAIEPTRPYVRITGATPGVYMVTATFTSRRLGTASTMSWELFDSATSAVESKMSMPTNVAGYGQPTTLIGYFTYTAATTTSDLGIRAALGNAADTAQIWTQDTPTKITIYKIPTTQESAVRVGTEAWKVDANISGANPSIGNLAATSYTEIVNASLTLTNNTGLGNIAAQIPCSTTNPPTGTTCAAGNESIGVSFTVPRAGDVIACASFGVNYANGAAATIDAAYQIVETANSAQTILQEGKGRVPAYYFSSSQGTVPFRVCGTFSFSAAGQKTLRLMYEQGVVGTPTTHQLIADAASTVGQRDIHWEVYPLTQGVPQPVILNGVAALDNSSGSTVINTIVSKSADYTATTSEETIVVDASGGTRTITLPAANTVKGKKYEIIQSSTANNVIIDPNGSETVCGSATIRTYGSKDSVVIQSDGTNWVGLAGACKYSDSAYIQCGNSGSAFGVYPNTLFASVSNGAVVGGCTVNFSHTLNANPRCVATVQSAVPTNFTHAVITAYSTTSVSPHRALNASNANGYIYLQCEIMR